MKSKKKKMRNRCEAPRCPYCGATTVLRSADGIYKNNCRHVMLYVCRNYPSCDSYVRVKEGTTIPMGTLANPQLRKMRTEAHRYFDRLYKRRIMSRQDAYQWLADLLCCPLSEAHIGLMGEYNCQRVIDESKKLLDIYRKKRANARKESKEV